MRGLRRPSADVGPTLVADLQERLRVYTRPDRAPCMQCGRWVSEKEAQEQRSYQQADAGDRYCPECERREFGAEQHRSR